MAERRVLMIAYHFPPLKGSSGILRTLHFVRDLPRFGWQPAVLSAHPRAYEACSEELLAEVPAQVPVSRAFALDARRHLSLWRRYPGWLARPDRWTSWLLGAIPRGWLLIRRLRPAVLWSTYPIPSAHLIGYWLARLSGLPWVADFRDPMAHDGYPEDAPTWQSFLRTEQRVFARADLAVFATPGAAALYRARYPAAAARIHVVENGYDEASFADLGQPEPTPLLAGKRVLLHSGIVYPAWRNPEALFAALHSLLDSQPELAQRCVLRFRAPVHDAFIATLRARYGLQEQVEILPALPYRAALAEMLRADGLLLLQSADCNAQIPAKFYEYLRAGRPICALTDPAGDTASAMRAAGLPYIAALDDAAQIAITLQDFLRSMDAGTAPVAKPEVISAAARSERARELAQLLDGLHQRAAKPNSKTSIAATRGKEKESHELADLSD